MCACHVSSFQEYDGENNECCCRLTALQSEGCENFDRCWQHVSRRIGGYTLRSICRDVVCYEDGGSSEGTPLNLFQRGKTFGGETMGVVVLDGSTVREFAEDEVAFNKVLDSHFLKLDANNDGVLSRCELRKAFESLRLLEAHFGMEVQNTPDELNALYNSVFDKFDTDRNDKVDLNEFRSEMKKIMLAIADGLGAAPIQLVLEDESLLKEAADFESAKAH